MKMKKMLLGIDIGGTKCSVSIGALDGEVVEAVKFPTNADAGHKPCVSNNFKKDTILQKNPTAADVGKGAEAGDELCLEILRVSGEHLGRGLAIVIDLLNPEKIVIGSIFRRCERFLRPAMEKTLEEECMRGTLAACEVLPAQLGETLGDVAAIALARSALTK
ncbi:MAG: ROK family protein [Kiritimatiellaeota bacterium]|nr:ROK family protein [Kiritimatiellota bacterium]